MNTEASPELVRDPSSEYSEPISTEHDEAADPSKPQQQLNEHVQALIVELDQLPEAEQKLQRIITFMESALGQNGTPYFKSFWEARNLCLPLFKEHISATSRLVLWEKYSALSKEARRLKELLNEQSAFAEEQIDIAIQALESDISKLEAKEFAIDASPLPILCDTLKKQQNLYNKLQHELNLLNASASRINALRKELIKTDMRVRKKNKLFQRLSAAGDRIFPRRKELIVIISQQFMDDVEDFIKSHFTHLSHESFFSLREEIKALQSIAKVLTLNARSFNETRTRLSDCWNKLKDLDKERKQQRIEKKSLFQQNMADVQLKITEISQEFQANHLTTADAEKKLHEITSYMKRVELGREELQILREQLHAVRQPIIEQLDKEAQIKVEQEQERIRHKQQKIIDMRTEVEELLRSADTYEVDNLIELRDALLEKITASPLLKAEKESLERKLKSLRDVIADKKEQGLLTLSQDEREALKQLYDLLKQRKERRQEIKEQIDSLRKAAGASGLDFVKAMDYQSQLKLEKERLEKMNQGIEEIEQKIACIEEG